MAKRNSGIVNNGWQQKGTGGKITPRREGEKSFFLFFIIICIIFFLDEEDIF